LPYMLASPFLLSITATGAVVTQTAQGYTLCPFQSSGTRLHLATSSTGIALLLGRRIVTLSSPCYPL
jgi:hypothetical protein